MTSQHYGFTEEMIRDLAETRPVVSSLLDVDFYKFTMGQFAWRFFRDVEVTFSVILRDRGIDLAGVLDMDELRTALQHVQELRFTSEELAYLKGMRMGADPMFEEGYLTFLRDEFRLPPFELKKSDERGGISLRFTGRWPEVTFWETIALAIISELYYRRVAMRAPVYLPKMYDLANERFQQKLRRLWTAGVSFADFGQRRRHSLGWQSHIVYECKNQLERGFIGTSNTMLAMDYQLTPIGTNAHELPMVLTALADNKREAQYDVLRRWESMYGANLRILLPDTYTSRTFFEGLPSSFASWRGMRQDSGDPVEEGEQYIAWLRSHDVDPRDKLIIFSDGLDVDEMIRLKEHFEGRIKTSFGWGTLLTNDFRGCFPDAAMRPFSIVCKVTSANGKPCVKLSNNFNKATGASEPRVLEEYFDTFRVRDHVDRPVIV